MGSPCFETVLEAGVFRYHDEHANNRWCGVCNDSAFVAWITFHPYSFGGRSVAAGKGGVVR